MQLICPELEQIKALDSACFSDPYPESIWINYLQSPARFPVYAFKQDGELVGYVCFSVIHPEAELLRIGVLPAFRSRGVGYEGLSAAQSALQLQGVVRLMLEVRESNTEAQALYKRLGYVNDGVRAMYYPATADQPAEGAVLMSLFLGSDR